MVDSEFERWKDFYLEYPFDDYHRIHKPFALLSSLTSGNNDFQVYIDILAPEPIPDGMNEADMSILKALGGKIR